MDLCNLEKIKLQMLTLFIKIFVKHRSLTRTLKSCAVLSHLSKWNNLQLVCPAD